MSAGYANEWTDVRDRALRGMRHDRVSWDAIASTLGLPVSTCMDRARAIGARPALVVVLVEEDVSNMRLPLPPGHPTTWGLLTRGTVLEGSRYG